MVSPTDYKSVLARLDKLAQEMAEKLGGIPSAEREGIRIIQQSGLPDFVISTIERNLHAAAREVNRLGREALDEVHRLLQEANAPFTMAGYDDRWQAIKAL